MKKSRFSVDFILKSSVARLTLFSVAAILIAFLSQFYVLSYQSHRAACEIVMARLGQFIGPISRELAVGDIQVAKSMFDDFIKVITIPGAKPRIEMKLSSDSDQVGSEKTCEASMFGADIHDPISFAGKPVAVIQGRITYFPTMPLLLFAVVVILGLIWGVKIWAEKLIGSIQNLVIRPIKELSIGRDVCDAESLPFEVQDVSQNIARLKAKLVEEEKRTAELAYEKQMSEMVVQVAHDIRSPLSVLAMMDRDDFQFTKETKTLMAAAAKRIQDISQSLTKKYRKQKEKDAVIGHKSSALVSVVIEAILSEKRSVAADRDIHISHSLKDTARNAFIEIESVELGRVISNLIDNAIEALENSDKKSKEILVTSSVENRIFEIAVRDTGPGVSPEILPTLSQKGVTLKNSGNGLGLFHARNVCEKANGQLEITSELGRGMSVIMKVPVVTAPAWFADRLSIPKNAALVLIDDDETIHKFWLMSLKDRKIERCYSGEDPRLQILAREKNHFFFVDYQLGQGHKNGIEVIKALGIAGRAVLVTSRFDDASIQETALQLNVKIVPKQILGSVVIDCLDIKKTVADKIDLALIDDDFLIRDAWEFAAEKEGLGILTFDSVEMFLKSDLPKETPIFLDQYLGENIRGTSVASEIWNQGYKKIHLTTGDSAIQDLPETILSVQGKGFPSPELF